MSLVRSCLLIGNTRWHWAEQNSEGWDFFHTFPDPNRLKSLQTPLSAWAAAGPIPEQIGLDSIKRLEIKHVPLKCLPPWLGIDRAFGAWGAFRKAQINGHKSNEMLIADVGTVMSLTRVKCDGQFAGGQLIAGLRLQLSAMAKGGHNLCDPGLGDLPVEPFPFKTDEAMRKGSLMALVGALIEAQRETTVPIWLCGGDGPIVFSALQERGLEVFHYPNLALEGMVDIEALINQGQDLQ